MAMPLTTLTTMREMPESAFRVQWETLRMNRERTHGCAHLVTDQLPLLLAVVLEKQFHFIRRQVHGVLDAMGMMEIKKTNKHIMLNISGEGVRNFV